MKDKKVILYALLGAVLFMIWTTWQQEHKISNVTNVNTTENVSATSITSNSVDSTNGESSSKKSREHRILKVNNGVLDIDIDTSTGNIQKANLSKYKETTNKDSKNIRMLYAGDSIGDSGKEYTIESSNIYTYADHKNVPISDVSYTLKSDARSGEDRTLMFAGKTKNGLLIEKKYVFHDGKYSSTVEYRIKNLSKNTWSGKIFGSIETNEGANDKQSVGFFGFKTFDGVAISTDADKYKKYSYSDIEKEDLSKATVGGWIAIQRRYFVNAIVPDKQANSILFANKIHNNQSNNIGFMSPLIGLNRGEENVTKYSIYIGPKISEYMNEISDTLYLTADYGWLWYISSIMFYAMHKIYLVCRNWGLAIIVLTLFIKLLFYKLSENSYKAMLKMKALAPRIQEIRMRYKDDKQSLGMATMELYKSEKVSPIGGCLPMILQIPVFLALYYVLLEDVQLRQASFLWIHDLSTKDPFYITPVIMGVSMWIQQKMNPQSQDPMQAKMMMLMPVVFTVFFASFPSGLVLYWMTNNYLSILQQMYINKKYEKK